MMHWIKLFIIRFYFLFIKRVNVEVYSSSLSKKAILKNKAKVLGGAVIYDYCELGAYSYVNSGVKFISGRIGNYSSIGYDTIIGPQEHPTDQISSHSLILNKLNYIYSEKHPPIIGHNVWVGARVIILKGVTIGNNSIVAAGSVVTRNIPDNSIVAGIPARVIKSKKQYTNLKDDWFLEENIEDI